MAFLQVAGAGFEVPSENKGEIAVLSERGAESGALNAKKINLPPDLASVVEAWPKLPEAIRAGILAMIRAAE